MTDAREVLRKKRDGEVLSAADIALFLDGYVAGEIPDYVASALLACIFVRGMEPEELAIWTRGMLATGRTFQFTGLDRPLADKHSTGGVGDKVSIPLAPAVASCGVAVPMISGRGLGHTGGTLDKLESIPGFRTSLAPDEFEHVLRTCGAALGGQTADLVPADRKLYALRDATGLIESIPLIASSILSKKLAEGIDVLVLDVKFGSGAFLPERERGAELARTMIELATHLGVKTVAFQTAMDRPLGLCFGNALEIEESIDCLRGGGPKELRELVCTLGGAMLAETGVSPDDFAGRVRIAASLDDGSAFETFLRLVEAQGGDPRAVVDPAGLPRTDDVKIVHAPRAGHLTYTNVRALGRAIVALGGGRRVLTDEVDPAVGIVALAHPGERVDARAPLFELRHRAGKGLDEARLELERAFALTDEAPELAPLVGARLGA